LAHIPLACKRTEIVVVGLNGGIVDFNGIHQAEAFPHKCGSEKAGS